MKSFLLIITAFFALSGFANEKAYFKNNKGKPVTYNH